MAVYSIDVPVYATAYIRAKSAAEARRKLVAFFEGMPSLDLEVEGAGGDFEVSGEQFDSPNLPEISLSPAMSVYRPRRRAAVAYQDEEG